MRYGASPRAAQALVLGREDSRAAAGSRSSRVDDIEPSALAALRHRVLLNFEGETERIEPDTLVTELVATL